jgi:hypothetical protein
LALLQVLNQYVTGHGAVLCVGLTKPDPQVERSLRESKIQCLDLSTDLRLEGDWHWSPEGNVFVAEKIERFLVAGKYL